MSDLSEAWNDTVGVAEAHVDTHVAQHAAAIEQGATIALSGIVSATCLAATEGACVVFLPTIGAATGAALYTKSGGPHTAQGYARAAAEGGIGGAIAGLCYEACAIAGSIALGGFLANGGYGAVQGAWDYSQQDGPDGHTAWGYIDAAAWGFIQGGFPWDDVLKWLQHDPATLAAYYERSRCG